MKDIILIPKPKIIRYTEGGYKISNAEIKTLRSYRKGGSLPGAIKIEVPAGSSDKKDSYSLVVDSAGIKISAPDEHGVFYAVQTLIQLAAQSAEGNLPCIEVTDYPDFPVRAVMLDISRDRVPKVSTLKAMIGKFAEWKINQFQLYTEHTFAYTAHEKVWADSSAFSPEEIRDIAGFCEERFIELVPNQNSFGHMERWFKHSDYHHLAESPGGFEDPWGIFREYSSTISPVSEDAESFLGGLYDELLPCFNSEYLNVGGDEPWELGKGRSRELCEQEGLENVYLDFLLKLRWIAAERKHKIQVYGDIIMKYPHLIKELPDDMILINWGYEADHPFEEECPRIAESGIPYYVCVGNSAWNSIGGRWSNTRENIKRGAVNAIKNDASGFMISEWGDNGHWQQYVIGLPGFMYGACAAWNTGSLSGMDEQGAAAQHLFNGDINLAAAMMKIQDVWECSGKRLHNVSLPAVILLDPAYPYYRDEYTGFRDYSFSEEEVLLNEALRLLDKAGDCAERDELLFSAELLLHGCRLGRLQFSTESLTAAAIPEEERAVLAGELDSLIKEYRRLWLARSRPGGLEDSVERFVKLMELYNN